MAFSPRSLGEDPNSMPDQRNKESLRRNKGGLELWRKGQLGGEAGWRAGQESARPALALAMAYRRRPLGPTDALATHGGNKRQQAWEK